MKVAARALPAHPHQMRGEHDVGVVEQRVMARGFGVEDVQPDPAEPAVLQRRVDGVDVDESAAAAVDQDRPGLDVPEQLGPDQVMGGLQQRQVQGDHVAAADQVLQVGAADIGRRFADRVVGQHPHPQRGAEGGGPLPDPAVADDAEDRPVEVTDRHGAAGRPLSATGPGW